jgi:prepilin-type N-terminal cleavage/methylation domain-containing protein/prepilin-type processing-associated H-X9-DG protein
MKTIHRLSSLKSFTLVELLVVMGIIAVLAGVIMSAIPTVIRSAHFAASTSNMRQIGNAINTYAVDNDSQLPVWYDYNVNQYWWQTLTPYLGGGGTNYNVGVYHDPGDTYFDGSSYDQLSLTISYGYNYIVMGRSNQSTDAYPARRLVNMTQASTTLALTDGPDADCYGYIDYYGHGPDTNRYSGKTPALFADGHVETLTTDTNFQNETPYFNRN